jgi:tetratricopeptide (TPR) repeat protein
MSERLAKLMKILAADPNDTFVLYGIAQEHAKAGDYGQAVAFYDKTLATDPVYCYAYFHKARSQQAAGDMAGARATAAEGVRAAQKAGDGKALGELSGLVDELGGGA